ncbi:hypothetical protein [Streptomyces sp. CBMA123]|uniref:hypothetical protein n=1 Tax=Streptomyces sp. CBMA123 TaxID=1896313 RepID=UPI001661C24A|nr:hypothetical protein [Streptomyces sp. CBMA123]MBD0696091.1 hypothetical protein [Streptomyces sp. CBMA123]
MTVPAEVREHWREARAGARTDGLVPALTLLSRALSPGAPPRGPRGHAVVPRELLDGYGDLPDEEALGPLPDLAVLHPAPRTPAAPIPTPRTPADSDPPPRTPADPGPRPWDTGLAWLRLGHSERLREACVAYLAARRVEGTSLLLQQLVKGALADALIEQLEIAGVLDGLAEADEECDPCTPAHPLDARSLARLQAQITEVDRALLRLLGAHGFTAEGPGRDAYASELLADVYCGRPGPVAHHHDTPVAHLADVPVPHLHDASPAQRLDAPGGVG